MTDADTRPQSAGSDPDRHTNSTPARPRRDPTPSPPRRSDPALGPLGRLGRLSYRRRGLVVLSWLAVLVLATVLSTLFGGDFTVDYSAPGSDSQAAQQLLTERFPARSGEPVTVVVRADAGASAVRDEVRALFAELAKVPHVASVEDPYEAPGGISPDGRTVVGSLLLDVVNPNDMPVADSERITDIARDANRAGMRVAVGGQAIQIAEQGEVGSEGIGLLAAVVILLLMFGSVVAAGLPILVAVAGLAVSSALTGVLLRVVDAPDWSTSLATMMSIGIGIDYVLLMVTRFREWRAAGLEPEAATVATLDTAGRSVMVAGGTVVISMLGLFAMGLSFMRGAALVTILGVLVVMAASVTLFPAMLAYLGRHIDRLRIPMPGARRLSRRTEHTPKTPETPVPADAPGSDHRTDALIEPGRGWLWWSGRIQRHRVLAAGAGVAILLVLAIPFLGVRFGFPDAGNNPEGSSTRQAYDLVTEGFGAGANGPLLIAVELPGTGGAATLTALGGALGTVEGIAAVTPPRLNPAGNAAVLTVIPTTGPQDARTDDLVHRLRDVLPGVLHGTGATVHVGGVTATSIDSTSNVARRIPLLIAGVVLLSMVLLLVAFRSVNIAVKAAVMNLLSVAASYGVVALVLRGGWAGRLVGIDTETPLPSFVPVLMFAVLFGLSMDYEVFLVSRMREVWVRTNDSARAVTVGLASTARVITAAAAIMIGVFAAFVPSQQIVLKVIGLGMAAAILLDATVVRLLLVPAIMHLLGRASWWMPRWLTRTLPEFHVEGRPHDHLPAPALRPALAPSGG